MTTASHDGPISPLTGLGVAILAVSTSAILVRWSNAPSLVKAFYRVVFTVALLAPVALVRHRDAVASISRRDLWAASGAGVALAAHFASWFESLNHTTVAASVTLVQAQPLFVAVGAWAFLDERVSRRTTLGIGVALAGMVLMSLSDLLTASGAPRPLFGNALAIVGAVTAAAYVLTGRSVRSRVALVPYVVVVYSVCALALLSVAVARGDPLSGYPPREWLLFFGMAVGPGIFGHTVINWALAHLESSVVSVSLLGEPVGSTILALFLLGEIPTLPTVLGGAIVLGGIYITAS
ncbi:EamA family transporter [Haloferax sp. MBLA0076]|uniref:EamA family transporter n=1 Tax=Haloferax litoreum TaxID=2666140 RepID=A0A6A8GI55_9EURY|nr:MULTISPECIES: DMT family transporter [Haloferax]KAB1194074.1 DMT family transporter [Haloferax sp. CBA1148]MRX22626.1 EamA family transporter [Haloferax litoreum]